MNKKNRKLVLENSESNSFKKYLTKLALKSCNYMLFKQMKLNMKVSVMLSSKNSLKMLERASQFKMKKKRETLIFHLKRTN
jgi:hypothetical protein